jgi:hypothetical protein
VFLRHAVALHHLVFADADLDLNVEAADAAKLLNDHPLVAQLQKCWRLSTPLPDTVLVLVPIIIWYAGQHALGSLSPFGQRCPATPSTPQDLGKW